jgi:predicted transcriptional regulator
MPTTKVKDAARQLIDQLPEEVTWDEFAYQIEVRASIERGLADADAGRLISHEEIEKRFGIAR